MRFTLKSPAERVHRLVDALRGQSNDQIVTVERFGRVQFRCDGAIERWRTESFGEEEIPLGAFLFLIRPGDHVWDVGASVGLYALHAAMRGASVLAFEPDPRTHRRLQENVALNGLDSSVRTSDVALGAENGSIRLYTDGLEGKAPAIGALGRHTGSVEVTLRTVDSFIDMGERPPSVVKMDIEGAEELALRGAQRFLGSKARPRVLFVEVHPQFLTRHGASAEDVRALLSSLGYVCLESGPRSAEHYVLAIAAEGTPA